MHCNPQQVERFVKILNIPDVVVPWLDRFFEAPEVALIDMIGDGTADLQKITDRWKQAASLPLPTPMEPFLDRCIRRGIINRRRDGTYEVTTFSVRYDIWALFEGWMDVPEAVVHKINDLEMAKYVVDTADQIEALKNGLHPDVSKRWPAYILLNEADRLVDLAEHVYLWPCNCRLMMKRCRRPVYTCVRFSNARGLGWELSKTRAKSIIAEANRSGLMQSGEIALTAEGSFTGAICNCCTDCCYPHQLAERVDARQLFPLTRYTARRLKDRCTLCGRCVKRCPFGAFEIVRPSETDASSGPQKSNGKKRGIDIVFDSRLCRGCGLCSTTCPEEAIKMVRLPGVKAPWEARLLNVHPPARQSTGSG